jgi:GxxExxY protein
MDHVKQQTSTEYSSIPLRTERIERQCLDAAFKVHSALGPGLLESVYERVLSYELMSRELTVENQKVLPLCYNGILLDSGLRLDILVENDIIIELKAVEKMIPLYEAQLLSYLKLSGLRLGYLINFNVVHLKDGIQRRVC